MKILRAIWLAGVAHSLRLCASAADTNSPDAIPPLIPPRGEIPPSFWDQHGLLVVVSSVLLLVLLGIVVWFLARPRPPVAVPPVTRARRELEPLRREPETGAALSRVSHVVKGYFASAYELPAGELTTDEFCRAVAGDERVGSRLSAEVSGFLRRCDERKFSPAPPQPPLGAATQAIRLLELSETRLAELSRATQPAPAAPTSGANS